MIGVDPEAVLVVRASEIVTMLFCAAEITVIRMFWWKIIFKKYSKNTFRSEIKAF